MINQPVLNSKTAALPLLRYTVSYSDKYLLPDDPQLDESHIHDCYELYIKLGGDVSFLVNNHLYSVQAGDVIVTRPGDVHLCILNSACVHEHFCLWISVPDDAELAAFLQDVFGKERYTFGNTRDKLTALLSAMRSQDKTVWQQTACLLQVLSLLRENGESHVDDICAVMPHEMQMIVDDINENFAQMRSIGDILARHYVSRATLARWFRKYMHLSPKEFLEAKKLSHAKSLLEGGMSVTDVYMQAGFGDCSHFIAVFKKRFGETPLRYKNHAK